MNINAIENLMSPVHNEGHTFIYFAEYDDGGYFYEYDNETNHHKFDDMDKEKVVKFGLIGNKLKLYFDLNSGMFYLNNSSKISSLSILHIIDLASLWLVIYVGSPDNIYPII